MANHRVERAQICDWQRTRNIRLRALTDTPDAFGSVLADERQFQQADWMARLTRERCATFLASIDAHDIAMVVIAPYHDDGGLYGMWVAPEGRGLGVGDSLITTALNWARACGFQRIFLGVGDANLPALRLYERHGFLPTGETGTLPPPRTHVREHTRMLTL